MAIKGVYMFLRVVNILTGIALIALAILTVINIFNAITLQVFLIPSPFFIGFFGFLLIAAELKIKAVLKHVQFLESLIGRGIFNVYLSSVAFWFLQDNKVIAWIAAILLFVSGIIYIVFHCGYAKQLKEQYDKEKKQYAREDEDKRNPIRQNLI